MPDSLQTKFTFGHTKVKLVRGNILHPPKCVEALVSTDDNYLTMGQGVSRDLAREAGAAYVREAQRQTPVKAGAVVVTSAGALAGPKKGRPYLQYVLHATIIDYDTYDSFTGNLVYQATTNALQIAVDYDLTRLVMPALATGPGGGLTMQECAQFMCTAIKHFVAREQRLRTIYLMLYEDRDEADLRDYERRANLVLGTPFDPAVEIEHPQNFYGREDELRALKALLSTPPGDRAAKRHAVIRGGPAIGKGALLDQLYSWALQEGPRGQFVARLEIGRVHAATPTSFVYRRLLSAMAESEPEPELRQDLIDARADPKMDRLRFYRFLNQYPNFYGDLVFFVEHLPRLLDMDADLAGGEPSGQPSFWKDLKTLHNRVRFIFTSDNDACQDLLKRIEPHTRTFGRRLEVIQLRCLQEPARAAWIDALFKDYLGHARVSPAVHEWFAREAGLHPTLIAMLGHALITAVKRDALYNPDHPTPPYTAQKLAPFFRQALEQVQETRRQFFDGLLSTCDAAEHEALQSLAKAKLWEDQIEKKEKEIEDTILPGLLDRDPDALEQYQQLRPEIARMREQAAHLRNPLHPDTLASLADRGLLIDAGDKQAVRFMADSFGAHVGRFVEPVVGAAPPSLADVVAGAGAGLDGGEAARPQAHAREVTITFLQHSDQEIMTLLDDGGPSVDRAYTRLISERKSGFLQALDASIRHWRDPTPPITGTVYTTPSEAGRQILTRFTTSEIRKYLRDLPRQLTLSLAIDGQLKEIPWELMIEPNLPRGTKVHIGRSVVGAESGQEGDSAGLDDPVRALLIGDPDGTLPLAKDEVDWLAGRLEARGAFQVTLRTGPGECDVEDLLNLMINVRYGLIHYAGHSTFKGTESAWLLAGGKYLNTDDLTTALQGGPPALVYSSSCASAAAGGGAPAPSYEFQTFDLPSTFLTAGVQAYVGTLWPVDSDDAELYARTFYEAFLEPGGACLGECMRLAKIECRRQEEPDRAAGRQPHNWLAYVLYGNPRAAPADLFPALAL